ncbi:polyadenylate-binding protein-interacting protein 2 [Arapaima gigas]
MGGRVFWTADYDVRRCALRKAEQRCAGSQQAVWVAITPEGTKTNLRLSVISVSLALWTSTAFAVVERMKDPGRSSTSGMMSDDLILGGQFPGEENPFAEYMWMENEEEFNRQIEEELWEEEFIERCFQEMLEEEEEYEWFIPARDLPDTINHLQEQLNGLVIGDGNILEDLVVNSNLNPNAKEFVPGVKY